MQTVSSAYTLWLTGLSGSGKSTLACALRDDFQSQGLACYVVDGDVLRQGLCRELGFSREDRQENIRRAAELCKHLNTAGVICIAALISPYHQDRTQAAASIGTNRFFEIYLSTPLSVCEKRDVKGLYRKARAGDIASFTGVSDPYQVPENPSLSLDTSVSPVDACVRQIKTHLATD